MEGSVENSEIYKKSRSLDLQSLYVDKSRFSEGGKETRVSKRKHRSWSKNEGVGFGKVKKGSKGTKQVSLSSFESVISKSNKSLNSVEKKNKVLNSGALRSNESGRILSSLSSISHSLDDGAIVIPKRPRGFVRRKKVHGNHLANSSSKRVTEVSNSSGASGSGDHRSKLTGDQIAPDKSLVGGGDHRSKLTGDQIAPDESLVGSKRKKSFDRYKGRDKFSRANSDSKRVLRNHRKKNKSTKEKHAHVVDDPSAVNSAKICDDLHEDDEENLEQNAARMLSSRFDPSCTGFSPNRVASTLKSANGSSFLPLLCKDFKTLGENSLADSKTEAAGRVLRPRKHFRQKGFARKRRHFYEVCYKDLDVYWVVNQRIKVFWPLDESWYFGLVKSYDPVAKLHHVKYDDRDEEWIDLQNERFKLLLLPSELPRKYGSEKSGLEVKVGKHVDKGVDVNVANDNCMGNFMDSEPIISWLSRSTRQVKSSPHGILKIQKRSLPCENLTSSKLSDDSVSISNECLDAAASIIDTDKLSVSNSAVVKSSGNVENAVKAMTNNITCRGEQKLPYVYVRRRFRKKEHESSNTSEKNALCRSVAGSVSFLASVVDRVGALEEFDTSLQTSRMKETDSSLFKLAVLPLKFKQVKLRLSLPLQYLPDLVVFGSESFRLYSSYLLLRHGTMTCVWPRVNLEVLLVDNTVGLRFLSFEGCLGQAVTFVCLILATICQPNEYGNLADLDLPVTSIRFKLSGLQYPGRGLVFMFHSFLEVRRSKWLFLDRKLRRHCTFTKELPLSECTYANIKILESGSDKISATSVCNDLVLLEGTQKRSRQAIELWDISKISADVNMNRSFCNFDGKFGRLPPFVISFAAAPTFFLSLHLKMLMGNNVASVNFQKRDTLSLQESPEYFEKSTDDGHSMVEQSPDVVSETTLENMGCSLTHAVTAFGQSSCAHSKVETYALSIRNDGDWIKSSEKSPNSKFNVTGTSVGDQDSRKNERQCHTESGQFAGRSWSSASEDLYGPNKSENGFLSYRLNNINVQSSPPIGHVESLSVDVGATQTAQQKPASDLAWSMNDCTICSPNPTAPRSVWHRRRSSISSSFGYNPKLCPDGRVDPIRNGFANGSKKPRSQISYLLPAGSSCDFGSKPRSHHWKGHSYKRIKNDNVKRMSVGTRSSPRYLDSLSCDANVLVTSGDRGWRECGAQVVLELVDHKEWRLLVKILGTTKYSHKAHQFLQPGTTNRYTHAMMWKGGKDWILEFSDRTQWMLFKEMHEECYNRNIRAASVKNIPIPGVRLIEDSDDNIVDVQPFVSSPKYFRQVGTEVDMAMDSSCILYDMDSDDEEWLSKLRNSEDINGRKLPEALEEVLERVMDMFEKLAYAQQRDNFSSDEIEWFMVGVGPMDFVKAIYEHWRQKRQRKGMPLIRQFQPPLWERYQQQLKDWELVINKMHNFSNGCKEKAVSVEKPPMFAFCLRPRGLEVANNKGSKQRPLRKFSAGGGHSIAFPRDQDGLHNFGRKLNGFSVGEENVLATIQNQESSDGSERNQYPKLHRNKSKKMGMFSSPSNSHMLAMPYNQRTANKRNGVCRLNMGLLDWPPTPKQYPPNGFPRHRANQLDDPEFDDEFRLRDASGAAQHALNMAKLKRERAQRLLQEADLAVHKAVVALMIAEAKKASEEESISDG